MSGRKNIKETEFRRGILEDHRPWGQFRAYPSCGAKHVKIITVDPRQSLSLQYHKRRSEFWVALDAGLEITLGSKVWRPAAGEEIFIPIQAPHRLRCVGSKPARVMEIWLGSSTEEDIVRLDDVYGRRDKTKP